MIKQKGMQWIAYANCLANTTPRMSLVALPCADSCRTLFTNCSKAEAIMFRVQSGGNMHCFSFKRQKQLRPDWDRGPQSRHWYEVIARTLWGGKKRGTRTRVKKMFLKKPPLFLRHVIFFSYNVITVICSPCDPQHLTYLQFYIQNNKPWKQIQEVTSPPGFLTKMFSSKIRERISNKVLSTNDQL